MINGYLFEYVFNYLNSNGNKNVVNLDDSYTATARDIIRFMDEIPGGFLIYRANDGEEIIYAG